MFVKSLGGLFYIGKSLCQIRESKLEFDAIRMICIIAGFLNAVNNKLSCCFCCIKRGLTLD